MSPENRKMGIGEKFIRFASIASLAFVSKSCVEPTITPNPTNPNNPTATETFIPTSTEIPRAEYVATELALTSLVEKNPETVSQDYKDLLTSSFDLAKTMSEFDHFTPRIWTLSVNDDGPKKDESLILAQNQTTNEFYILTATTGSGTEQQTTLLKEKVFAEVVMGEGGQPQKIRYYYNEEDGSQTEFLRYDPENKINNSSYFYTMTDGNEVALDQVGIYIGKTEDATTGGKLLSLVPAGEDFYKTLPAGSVINTETGKITDSSGEILYHLDGEWIKQPVLENGPSLEFSPLLPAVWSKEWTGKVGDLNIPIIIGISEDVYNDKTPPITSIKGVWMTQEGADGVADAFLRAAHYRYTKIMGNTATYEEYLDILKNQPHGGEVNLIITDNILKDSNGNPIRRETLIDPRQGFSVLMTDKIDPKIGVKRDRINSIFFGVDGQGRLLIASDKFLHFDFSQKAIVNGISIKDFLLIAGIFGPIADFAFLENKCMIDGNSFSKCGEPTYYPAQETRLFRTLNDKQEVMMANGSFFIPWGIERP